MSTMRWPGIVIVLLLTGGCSKEESPTAPTAPIVVSGPPTQFAFVSDPASRVGRGESPTFTRANATFQVGTDSQFVNVGVVPQGATSVQWQFTMHPPRGQKLVSGTFPLTGVGPSSGSGHGFEFSGGGNRCSSGSGTMTIDQILNVGLVDRLDVSFSVSCDGTPAVNGRIVLNWVTGAGYR